MLNERLNAAARARHWRGIGEGAEIKPGGFSVCALCSRRNCDGCVFVKRFLTASSIEYLPACADCAVQPER